MCQTTDGEVTVIYVMGGGISGGFEGVCRLSSIGLNFSSKIVSSAKSAYHIPTWLYIIWAAMT